VDQACGTHGRGEKRVQGFGGKETTQKTEALMRRWDQNESWGDGLGGVGCGVESVGSG
jgi:hypothetical protein